MGESVPNLIFAICDLRFAICGSAGLRVCGSAGLRVCGSAGRKFARVRNHDAKPA
ncbi:transcriptional regulator, AraC family [Burkholderia pseudomallei MSHR2138]|nr:transcriptional regulator, AraC family [Burkholderia pseudomallei MSHR2138]